MYDVVTVGSAILDIYMRSSDFKKIPSGEFEGGVALCEAYGGKVEVSGVELTTGGAGTNNAVSYARKGMKVGVICEMGEDVIGRTILSELEREGVDTSLVVREVDEETGLASIMVSDDGGRAIAVYRGASKLLTVEDIPWEKLDTKWLHVSSLGERLEMLKALVDFASNKGVKVAWNPGKNECEALRESSEARKEILGKLEVLMVNREEAGMLTGEDFGSEERWMRDEGIAGPKIVVVSDGREGGKVFEEGKGFAYERTATETVEETGAGDALGSGFVAGLIAGKDVKEAIRWGSKQAASVVGYMGPKRGLLSLEEISK